MSIRAAIEAILADPDMPEHMVTTQDDREMRALLERHLLPLETETKTRTYDCVRQLGCCYPMDCVNEKRCLYR